MTVFTAVFNRAQNLFSFYFLKQGKNSIQFMEIIVMEMPPISLTSMSFFLSSIFVHFHVAMPKTIAPLSSTKTAGELSVLFDTTIGFRFFAIHSSTYEKQIFLLLFSHHTKWLHRFSFRSLLLLPRVSLFFLFTPKGTRHRDERTMLRVFHFGKCLLNVYL